jgi:proteasome lid subunit RPN8/RPN11
VSARFVRQILLPEVGEAGQSRIVASTAAVAGEGLAHEIAGRYALGAGFAQLSPGAIDVDALAPAALVCSPGARQVLAGARAALAEMRRALDVPGELANPNPDTRAPWTRGAVRVTRAALAAVEADAVRGYAAGEEACGYLRGPAGDARCDEHVRLLNTADKLHALDPVAYFRTARTFFSFNEKRFSDAVDASAREGRPVKVLYHSHLDAGAYFSPTDAAVLSMGEPPAVEGGAVTLGPGPAWPLAFLVTSVVGGEIAAHGLFVWDAAAGAFVAGDLVVE